VSRSPGQHDADLLVLGIVAALACAVVLVWAWGGVAGELFGRGWPPLPPSAGFAVLLNLPSHLLDPPLAWPASARRWLPDPDAFYVSALPLVVAGAGVAALVRAGLGRAEPARLGAGGARWATARELAPLRARTGGGAGGRLALGRRGRRMLYAERRHALVAFGPPQSGKSAGLAIPALLEWDGPAIASSIKGDLVDATIARRQSLGETLVFDPFSLSGVPSQTWSPLHGSTTWDGAVEVAWRLAAAGELDQRGVDGGDFWAIAAEQRLAPLLYAAARTGGGIGKVVSWAYGQDARGFNAALERLAREASSDADRADARAAYDAARAFEAQADRTRSSIEATAQALLRAYRFARVARSAAGCEITADRILERPTTLYLVGDAKASKLLRPIFVALLSEVVDRAYELANERGGRLRLPLLVCLDEAGNVAPLPNLAEIASTAPSHNIQLISIFHDLAQARNRYAAQAQTVINSHRARMLLPGVADLETLRYFSGLLGEEERTEATRTVGAGGSSRSMARRRRPLLAAEALRQIPDGHALVLYGRLAPTRVRLRMWFRDRRLRALAGVPARTGAASESRAVP
jgi:type IV secretion system protein VirD4